MVCTCCARTAAAERRGSSLSLSQVEQPFEKLVSVAHWPSSAPPPGLQIATLPRLRHLHLRHPHHDAGSYAALTRLSLHTLELSGCVRVVPDCLSALTSLQCLAVDGCNMGAEEEADVAAGLAAALPHLTQLTQLAAALESPAPLAALTALTGLRWLVWACTPEGDTAALPPGSWLAALQTLAAPLSLVARSLPALVSAQRLEQLCLYMHGGQSEAAASQLRASLSWAVQQPSLQHLLLGDQPLPGTAWADVAAAARLRPSLRIEPGSLTHPALD